VLPYEAVDIRQNYRMMWLTTTVTATALALFNPYAPAVLLYDFYLLFKATQIMNQTCNMIVLDETKRHVHLNKLNFLGYYREQKQRRVSLRDVKYMGLYENTAITHNNYGLLPSISRYFNYVQEKKEADKKEVALDDKQVK
jgi:hypothetical protein